MLFSQTSRELSGDDDMNVKGYRSAFGAKLFVPKGLIFLTGVIILLLIVIALSKGERQPIAFNHQIHIQNNVGCITCHQYYPNYSTAGIPGVETCTKCHEDVIYLTPDKEKIQKYYKSGEEIPWKLMSSVPAHVYFSHSRHVTFGKVDCAECHGDVASWTRPPLEPEINLDMNMCIQCHQKMQERTKLAEPYNCNRCHR